MWCPPAYVLLYNATITYLAIGYAFPLIFPILKSVPSFFGS